MKRWLLASACACMSIGCEEPAATAAPSRVVAVSGPAAQGPDLAGFCDRYSPEETAPALSLPPLDAAAPASQSARWVNVWATWCKPCVEEIPRLLAWQKRLNEQGRKLDLVFVSVDQSVDAIAAFRESHPDMPASLHVSDAAGFGAWLPSVGLADGSPIPMHLYADQAGIRRCVRAGAVAESDFTFVNALVTRHP